VRNRLIVVLVGLALIGCDRESDTMAPTPSMVSNDNAQMSADLKQAASAVSGALTDPALRLSVRDAMRASRYAEHKVDLYDFLRSERRVAEAAAARLNMRTEAFLAFIRSLGPIDFYAPYRAQRTTWNGSADAAVGFTDNADEILYEAALPSGSTAVFNGNNVPDVMMLMIHPSELESVKLQRAAATKGDAIQDASEAPLAAFIVRDSHSGRIIGVTPFEVCHPDYGECGGGGGGSVVTTVLQAIVSFYGDGVGSAELEYTIQDATRAKTVRIEDVEKDILYPINRELWVGSFNWSGGINVELIETDFASDDHWGWATYTTAWRGNWAATETLCSSVGDPNTDYHPECGTPPYTTFTSNFVINW
jgi:hypothetical protein